MSGLSMPGASERGYDSVEAQPLSENVGVVDGQWFPDLPLTTRLQGFALFACLGLFSNCLAWVALSTGFYWKYAVLMTLGNVMSMCSTLLLMGPWKQLNKMWDETRRGSTALYLGSMLCTIIVSFVFRSAFLCALCCFFQYGAFIWYSLSYIPYGREVLGSCLKSTAGGIVGM